MNGWKTQAEVAKIKKQYPVGTKIELDFMDERDMPSGLKGIIDHVDDQGQLHMIWQNGRSLALVPGVDVFHVLKEPEVEPTGSRDENEDELEI